MLECPLDGYVTAEAELPHPVAEYVKNGFFMELQNPLLAVAVQPYFEVPLPVGLAEAFLDNVLPFLIGLADDVLFLRGEIFLKLGVHINDPPVVAADEDRKRHIPQEDLQLRAHVRKIGHVMRDADRPEDRPVVVEQRGLVCLELTHPLFALDHFVKKAGAPFLKHDLVRLQTNILALLVFFLLQIPYVIVAASLYVLLLLAYGMAKTVVDLQVRPFYILKPNKIGNAVDDRIQIRLGQAAVFPMLDAR